jgi:hypothetical protein
MVANWLVMAIMLLVSHDARRPVAVMVDGPDVESLSSDATQVIPVARSSHPAPRPEPRTASSAPEVEEDEPPARAMADSDLEPTAAIPTTPADEAAVATVERVLPEKRLTRTDPEEPTQMFRLDEENS